MFLSTACSFVAFWMRRRGRPSTRSPGRQLKRVSADHLIFAASAGRCLLIQLKAPWRLIGAGRRLRPPSARRASSARD